MTALRQDIDPNGLLEYSVVYTDRALNHMSKVFQQVMNDLSSNLKSVYNADAVGVLRMDMEPRPQVKTGDVGYIITGIKNSKGIKVGDTITSA